MDEVTTKELNNRYKDWLDKKGPPKVYCTLYPEFLEQEFPEGVKVNDKNRDRH